MLSSLNLESLFSEAMSQHLAVVQQLEAQRPRLEEVAGHMTKALLKGNKILRCGNGGCYRRDRPALASIALTENAAAVLGVANAYGFNDVFARQVEALCQPGDVFVGISTSGNSRNVVVAPPRARHVGAFAVAITGEHGGRMGSAANVWLRVPSNDTARIQEAYMLCGHMLCDWVELATCISNAMEMRRSAG